jgi:hypothetical protein
MCSRTSRVEKGENNLTLISTKPKKVLTLEELQSLRLNEQIEIEEEISTILREEFIRRYKR